MGVGVGASVQVQFLVAVGFVTRRTRLSRRGIDLRPWKEEPGEWRVTGEDGDTRCDRRPLLLRIKV